MNKHQFVGAYLPPQIAEEFNLYCLYKGISKTFIINGAISAMLVKNKSTIYPETLITGVASREFSAWQIRAEMNMNKNNWDTKGLIDKQFKDWMSLTRKRLQTHKISEKTIDLILKEIKGLKRAKG